MTLYLDLTAADHLILGLRSGKIRAMKTVALRPFRHDGVLRALQAFLQQHKTQTSKLQSLVVVNGPGRFSSLRVSATIANLFRWFHSCRLYTVQEIREYPRKSLGYLDVLDESKKPVKRVQPFYGRPPSITKPKRR